MLLRLGDRDRVGIDEMADAGIAADQDELLEGRADAAGLQQPEQALDRHVHDLIGRFLAGRQVHARGSPLPGRVQPPRDLRSSRARSRGGHAAAVRGDGTARARPTVKGGIGQQPTDEGLADLSGGSCDQYALRIRHVYPFFE